MRLLDTSTYEMVEVMQPRNHKYAILSHRWEDKEPTYQDYRTDVENGLKSSLFQKVRDACHLAKTKNHSYIWIDTICIDKTSSAELSEAVNAMFQWYRFANMCCVYLSDVVPAIDASTLLPDAEKVKEVWPSFSKSAWFTRGWTLQELLAPRSLEFYDANWDLITSKRESVSLLREITGIDIPNWSSACIAQKMSWAAERATTRPEDVAYSLLGIFDINMPLLYGEGDHRAFKRLQREIIASSDDESIFAWLMPSVAYGVCDLLAVHPVCFRDSAQVSIVESKVKKRLPYSVTNKGIHLQFPVLREPQCDPAHCEEVKIILNAWKPDAAGELRPIEICLWNYHHRDGWGRFTSSFWSYGINVQPSFDSRGRPLTTSIYVKQHW